MKILNWILSSSSLLLLFAGPGRASGIDNCSGKITFDSLYVVSVDKSLPKYYIRLVEREDTTGGYTSWYYEFRIQHSINGPVFQDICGESFSSFDEMDDEDYPGIEFVDLNFDGYLDIKMFDDRAANGVNAGYAAYLFNPATERFSHSRQFSEILGGYDIELDSTKKEITSSGELGCMGGCWSIDTYKVVGDSLVLIKRVHQDQDEEHPGKFVLIKEQMVNGVLTVTSRQEVKWP